MPKSDKTIVITYFNIGSKDAIGNDILKQYESLESAGYKVYLYAQSYNAVAGFRKLNLKKLAQLLEDPATILIYHHGNYWEDGEYFLSIAKCYTIMRFHNITPAHYYADYAKEIADHNEKGLAQTISFIKNKVFDAYLSTSDYNKTILMGLGANKSQIAIVAPFNNLDVFDNYDFNGHLIQDQLTKGTFNLLFVGRIAPHKGHLFLIEVMKNYVSKYSDKICLNIIGGLDPKVSNYYETLLRKIAAYQLDEVIHIHQDVSHTDLYSFFLSTHLLTIASEHEGFCVPVIEAQKLRIPVLALKRTAVPYTIGDNQVTIEDADPAYFAAAIHSLRKRKDFLAYLAEEGTKNVKQYTNTSLSQKLRNYISEI